MNATATQLLGFHVYVGEYAAGQRVSGFRLSVLATRETVESRAAAAVEQVAARFAAAGISYPYERRVERIRKAPHRIVRSTS